MPIYLPQLTRREFLKRAALATAAVAFAPQSHAGLFGKSRDKHTFAFFSDPHIAADATLQHSGVNMTENLAACGRELAARPQAPAAIIVNGDLAFQSGLAEDYATFGKTVAPLRALAPMHLSLGNHDARDVFWTAFPQDVNKPNGTAQKQATVFASERANWFLLDSLDRTASTPGEIGTAQFDWLNQELDARPEKPAIIVCHHNLQTPGGQPGLKDTAGMEEVFSRHRQIKAFVFGHTHNWEVKTHPASGVHLINLPPTGYVFKAGRPNGWVRCTLTKSGAEFELRSLDPKHAEHAQVKAMTWRTA